MEFIKKLLIVFLGSLCLLSGAFANLDSKVEAHYTLNNTLFDITGNHNALTNSGTINSATGISGEGRYFSTSAQSLTTDFQMSGTHSVSFWINIIDDNTWQDILGYNGNGNQFTCNWDLRSSTNRLFCRVIVSGTAYSIETTGETVGVWNHILLTYNESSHIFEYYYNNVSQGTQSTSGNLVATQNLIFGDSTYATQDFNGYMDEITIFNDAITQEEVSLIYSKKTYPFSGSSTPTIEHNVSSFYNSTSISIQLNTSTNTNMSYYLDLGSEVAICSDCNNSILNLSGLSEGSHSILFESTDSNGQVNSTANFTIDLTDPTINVFNTSTIETYSVTWSDVFNYSDANLDSCWIIVESSTENCVSYTFSENGNQSVQVYVNDSAGNVATTTFYKFIDPKVYVYFEDPATNPIVNFTFGGINYSDYAEMNIYDLGLGNHTLLFSKYGYAQTNITLEFTSTSNINTTETIQVSLLYVNIRDRQTEALITDTINFDLVGDSYAGSYSTSTGLKTITDIKELPGTYRLTFSGTGFAANDYYFQHTGYSSVNITTYLINESETIPIKIVLRDIFSNPKSACVIKAKQYFISANDYLSVDMKTTNSLGEVIFDLEYAKWYQFVVECDDVTQTEPGQQITSTPLYLTWNEDEALTLFDGLPNLAYDPISWTNTSNSTGYFRFEYNDLNNIVSQGCLYVYEKAFSGNILLGSSCVSSASATININANYTAESGKTYIARGYVTYEGETTFVDEGSQTFMKGEGIWDYGLGSWGSMLLIGVLFLIGSAMHPFAAIAFAWIGAAVSVKFEMLPLDWAALIGLGALVIGLIIFRGKKQ